MLKMFSLGMAATLAALVITAWATTASRPWKHPETAINGIDTFKLTTSSRNLQVQHFDTF